MTPSAAVDSSRTGAASIHHRPPNLFLHSADALSSLSVISILYKVPWLLLFGSSRPAILPASRTISPASILQQLISARIGSFFTPGILILSHESPRKRDSGIPPPRRFVQVWTHSAGASPSANSLMSSASSSMSAKYSV